RGQPAAVYVRGSARREKLTNLPYHDFGIRLGQAGIVGPELGAFVVDRSREVKCIGCLEPVSCPQLCRLYEFVSTKRQDVDVLPRTQVFIGDGLIAHPHRPDETFQKYEVSRAGSDCWQ